MNRYIFEQAIKEVGCYNKVEKEYSRYNGWKYNKNIKNLDECYLYIEWISGGLSGGSCWDTGEEDNHYSISAESEPEFKSLDNLLIKICPNITFLQYKNLMSKVLEISERSEYEYYGNYTDYTIKIVNLGKLYKVINEMGL